jgi:capsular exopolysaccharide synthesis family protein
MRGSGEAVGAVSDLLEGRGMASDNLPAIRVQAAPAIAPATPPRFLAAAAEETGLDWRRVASALWRFKWVMLLTVALGTAGGVGATRFLRPEYLAQATVWVDLPDRRGVADRSGPLRPGQLLDAESWLDLLKSYVVLDAVAREQRLYLGLKSPEDTAVFTGFRVAEDFRPGDYRLAVSGDGRGYVLAAPEGIVFERGAIGDSVGVRLGFLWVPPAGDFTPGRTIAFSMTTLRDAARGLTDALGAQMDPNGNFLRIELRGNDPRRVSGILNAVTERYVQVAAELKREKLTELTKALQEQLSVAHTNLQQAETALRTFRTETITLPSDRPRTAAAGPEARDPVFSNFFDMEIERDQQRRDREAIERLLADARASALPAGALMLIGSVQRSAGLSQALKELTDKQASLRSMQYRYLDDYAPVQRLKAEIADLETRTIPTLARALVAQLAAREAEVGRQVDATSDQLRRIPPRALEEARLQRSLTLAEDLYTTLQRRYEEAEVSERTIVPDLRILDAAVVPRKPVKNTAPRLMLLAFCGSFGLAVVGALLLDRIDPRVRYPKQVSQELGLPILGAVPHLKDAANPTDVVEALRGLCLNLVHAHGAAGPLLVTVTSPGAGDGKSFLTSNLALAFADGGHRTLLVDGDMRRGLLHRRFNANRKPGLIEFLHGDATREQIVQATSYPWLYLIGCGTRTNRAPELLGSAAMGQLVTALRSEYDVILVDSPPLGAGVDPFILGTMTGNVVLVLRTGYSHRDMVGAKLEVLDRLPVRTLGAVLNDVPSGAAYGYYSYYSYSLPGYQAVDEEDGLEVGSRPRVI